MFFMIKINLIKCKMVFFFFQKEFVVKIFEEEEEKGAKTQQKNTNLIFLFSFFSNFYDVNKLLKLFSMYLKLV